MDHRDGPMNACCYRDQCHADRVEIERLRKRLSGALQHLEAVRAENARLRGRCWAVGALLYGNKGPQAPIAKLIIRESGAGHYAPDDMSVSLYAPGLPPGEHDLFCAPESDGRYLTEHPTGD